MQRVRPGGSPRSKAHSMTASEPPKETNLRKQLHLRPSLQAGPASEEAFRGWVHVPHATVSSRLATGSTQLLDRARWRSPRSSCSSSPVSPPPPTITQRGALTASESHTPGRDTVSRCAARIPPFADLAGCDRQAAVHTERAAETEKTDVKQASKRTAHDQTHDEQRAMCRSRCATATESATGSAARKLCSVGARREDSGGGSLVLHSPYLVLELFLVEHRVGTAVSRNARIVITIITVDTASATRMNMLLPDPCVFQA